LAAPFLRVGFEEERLRTRSFPKLSSLALLNANDKSGRAT